MYLKSLELQGFKSFPDKIKLNFDKGLTAVVGPNGSGKSNIGDSVRWVLGEQSTKTLRGNKMEDVIFSGTVAKRPMGFAAVTLVIDNSEGRLEGYGDEVSVTRKLYRSGDSEYRINGKSVRLKDINELFMDTGLGRDGYSIIGQGRIAEIVGAKSNDRRELFEEAAGISKFRYRKQEAERKLDAAEENMERLHDIVSELEGRVEPLRRQAEKAQKFLVLAQEEKTLEISVWVDQLSVLQDKLKALEEKLLISRTEYENAERDIADEEEKIQNCYRIMQQCSVESEEAYRLVSELRELSAQIQSEIAVLKNDIVHNEEAQKIAEKRHAEELQERGRREQQLAQAEQTFAQMQEICRSTETALAKAADAFTQMESAWMQEDEKTQQADAQLHRLYLERSELQFAIRAAQEHAEKCVQEQELLESGSQEAARMLAEAEAAHAQALQAAQAAQEDVLRQEAQLAAGRQHCQALLQNRQNAEEQFRQLGFQMRDKKQRHRFLTDLENNMEGFSGSVKSIMRSVRQGTLQGIFGTVAQLIQVDGRYGIAIETALGASVQHLITADENAAKAGIRFLRDNRAGRATFLPLTSIRGKRLTEQGLQNQRGFVAVASDLVECDPAYRSIAESLLGRIVIAENIDDATEIAKRYSYRFRIVTMDGQVINAGGSFTGGSVQKTGGMLTRKTELNELQNAIALLAKQCQEAEETARRCAQEAAEAEASLQAEAEQFTALQQQLLQLQSEAERCAFPVNQYRMQAQEQESRRALLAQNTEDANAALQKAQAEHDALLLQITEAESGVTGARERRTAMQQERSRLSEEYGDLKIRLVQAQKDEESAANSLSLAREAAASAEEREGRLIAGIEQCRAAIAEKTKEAAAKEQTLADTGRSIAETEAKAKQASQAHDEQNMRIRQMQKGLTEFHAAKEKLSAEVTRLTEREEHLRTENDTIITQLLEVYELTRSEAQRIAEPIEDTAAARKRLSELKQKIRALGSVNVDAIEEYREVSDRYKFLSAQMADVRRSKNELEKLIAELTEEMCRIFSESFAVINQNFKEIFVDLFGGGKADLTLTDPENILTSGIEINVAPPGKVIKNLISLSGGEQSFVAIAIYLAILRLRPAPFCILDEIDAALDEANVRKYARYLKQFTDSTQFVLVTHRRSAMEEANVLYGVTMQEDGISRLLKLEQPEDIPLDES
ncbi:MAG: chromosome segregation protein SMC [Oscillospiraceae bacterium]|nr:chromosome segregation protein SMC [Oscillospiraceae bacterium]